MADETTQTMEVQEGTTATDVVMETSDRKVGSLLGNVKWFSSKLGFGFLTVQSEGEMKGKDIFCHHTGIVPVNSKFRTLVKGEYINFDVEDGPNGPQGVNITGVGGGALMCDNNINYASSVPPRGPPRGRPGNPQQYQQAMQYQMSTTTTHPTFQRQPGPGAKRSRTSS